MAITKFDPFALVGTTLFDDLNRLFDRPLPGRESGFAVDSWTPRVDIAETEAEFIVRAELPGIDPDSIDVTLEEDVLSIAGSRSFDSGTEETEEDGLKYRRREIVEGKFIRKIRLADEVDVDAVTATSSNGILEVTVPKQPAELPRKVTVSVQR